MLAIAAVEIDINIPEDALWTRFRCAYHVPLLTIFCGSWVGRESAPEFPFSRRLVLQRRRLVSTLDYIRSSQTLKILTLMPS
nr:hypothetical protein CFP56_54906 [Quercus suber]